MNLFEIFEKYQNRRIRNKLFKDWSNFKDWDVNTTFVNCEIIDKNWEVEPEYKTISIRDVITAYDAANRYRGNEKLDMELLRKFLKNLGFQVKEVDETVT